MGSTTDTQVVGQYMHPVIDQNTKNDDPWQRNYFAPPELKNLVPRTYPLIDIRPLLSRPEYKPADLLKSHGFGVVKQRSAALEQLFVDGGVSEHALADLYHPEIRELVMKTTGAKSVFITASVYRRGKSTPEAYKLPTRVGYVTPAAAADRGQQSEGRENQPAEKPAEKPEEKAQADKPADQPRLGQAAPVRTPHVDFTPLGARQTIRFQKQDIYNTAVESGVIAAEDRICENQPFRAPTKEADPLIAEQYNQKDKLGPRYAAYSIWRPVKKVGRDPITLAPRRESETYDNEMVYWPYLNRIPGPAELGGDYLKQYAMLGVKGEERPSIPDGSKRLKWYYLPAQEPDEVLFIQLFDSASLGTNAQHAGAPWHASPEIGAVEGDQPRESIDIRVVAFW
jgi:hypothetical protein